MKKILKNTYLTALGAIAAASFTACTAEAPFSAENEGDLRIRTQVSKELTRAAVSSDELSEKCVVYISSEKGLVRKYLGLQNVPDKITLKTGHYVAEAWTGDSVSASFDKKFYRGYQPFDMEAGLNEVTLTCRIANVVVSLAPESLSAGLSHLKVKVWNSRGELVFTEDNIDLKGYFMMPNADKDLFYKLEGEDLTGRLVEKEGVIENVKRAHEYILYLKSEGGDPVWGGVGFNVVIEDVPVVEETVEILGRPSIRGIDFQLDSQVVGEKGAFTDKVIYFRGFNGLQRLTMKAVANAEAMSAVFTEVGLFSCSEETRARLNDAGISWETKDTADEGRGITVSELYLTLGKEFLNSLPVSVTEYSISFTAADGQGKENEALFRLANSEGAVVYEDPVVVTDIAASPDYMAVRTTSAIVPVTVFDFAGDPALQYRESGQSEWQEVSVGATRATRAGSSKYEVKLSRLKASTTYEYRCVDGEFASPVMRFTTEGRFVIPNASMEEWSDFADNSKVLLPSANGQRTFWDTGNHGSAKMSKNITQPSESLFHTGSKSACLMSQFVGLGSVGKFAAGNIFAGTYLETQGTDGRLEFGRPYDGSHPDALSVWVNYRPGVGVNKKGANANYIPEGATDQGQIYIALTTEPVEIRTKAENQKLFNPEDECVLAYGQTTWTSAVGADGQLEKVVIPFEYNSRANKNEARYLVIVCTSSKFGDFFSGGEGSVMYLDDFELVY